MQQELNEEEKKNILKGYLGEFCVYFNDEEEKLFEDKLKDTKLSNLIKADDYKTLKKVVCYILLKLNKRIRFVYAKSNDILDSLFVENLEDEAYTFNDYQECQFLIIYHPKIWKKNKLMWQTLNYLCEVRTNMEKPTLIISDAYNLYDEHGSLAVESIINLSNSDYRQPTFTSDNNLISAFTGSSSSLYDD